MITRSQIKFVRSLRAKKGRRAHGAFLVEGDKLVRDALAAGVDVDQLYATRDWLVRLPKMRRKEGMRVEEIDEATLHRLSSLSTPHQVLAVLPMPQRRLSWESVASGLTLALDGIQDPGNLGTILRAAAWFGVGQILCSPDCVDAFNPKVIQASMGAFLHVPVIEADLPSFLEAAAGRGVKVAVAVLDGESIYEARLMLPHVVVLGNESHGVTAQLMPFAHRKITIPPADAAKPGRESLNVAMAAAIVCSEFMRNAGGGLSVP